MALTGLFIDLSTVAADLNSLTAMALLRRHKLDAAVAVLVVIPVHKLGNPLAGLLFIAEWPAGGVGPVSVVDTLDVMSLKTGEVQDTLISVLRWIRCSCFAH